MPLPILRRTRPLGGARPATIALAGIACASILGVAAGAPAQSVTTDIGPLPAARDYWLLSEFDWGDDREIVDESVQISPGFLCYKVNHRCQITRVSVDGEDVLARFSYDPSGLSEVAFVTPALDRSQAEDHLERVAKVLTGYLRRFQGKPDLEFGAPEVGAIQAETPTPIAWWKKPDMEIRVEAGRDGEAWYVGAFFSKPTGEEKAATSDAPPQAPPSAAP